LKMPQKVENFHIGKEVKVTVKLKISLRIHRNRRTLIKILPQILYQKLGWKRGNWILVIMIQEVAATSGPKETKMIFLVQ